MVVSSSCWSLSAQCAYSASSTLAQWWMLVLHDSWLSAPEVPHRKREENVSTEDSQPLEVGRSGDIQMLLNPYLEAIRRKTGVNVQEVQNMNKCSKCAEYVDHINFICWRCLACVFRFDSAESSFHKYFFLLFGYICIDTIPVHRCYEKCHFVTKENVYNVYLFFTLTYLFYHPPLRILEHTCTYMYILRIKLNLAAFCRWFWSLLSSGSATCA